MRFLMQLLTAHGKACYVQPERQGFKSNLSDEPNVALSELTGQARQRHEYCVLGRDEL